MFSSSCSLCVYLVGSKSISLFADMCKSDFPPLYLLTETVTHKSCKYSECFQLKQKSLTEAFGPKCNYVAKKKYFRIASAKDLPN